MDITERDLKHIWHPCSQMKDYETFPPVTITKAQGSYLHLANGTTLIDANSSWWCKSLGHADPRIHAALMQQAKTLEHTILANTTNPTIVKLSENLAALTPNLNKVMYASDGSCAVEMALKMSLHAQQLQGQGHRQQFAALGNGYHGETCLALSVSDCGLYSEPYKPLLQPCEYLNPIPYVSGVEDNKWHDCSEEWHPIEKQLNQIKDTLCAIIFEPIVQGAGQMQIYSANFLKHLAAWAKDNQVYLIADEIMTGFGRTGLPLAIDHAGIEVDFLCVAKGLTAGVLPISAMLTSDTVYDLFYDDYEKGKSFLHSHTHTGNTLAAAVANCVFEIFQEDNIYQKIPELSAHLRQQMEAVANHTGKLTNIRHIGAMVAGDLVVDNPNTRWGFQIFQEAIKLGAMLRPLGNTLYWFPPLNTESHTIDELADITQTAIARILK